MLPLYKDSENEKEDCWSYAALSISEELNDYFIGIWYKHLRLLTTKMATIDGQYTYSWWERIPQWKNLIEGYSVDPLKKMEKKTSFLLKREWVPGSFRETMRMVHGVKDDQELNFYYQTQPSKSICMPSCDVTNNAIEFMLSRNTNETLFNDEHAKYITSHVLQPHQAVAYNKGMWHATLNNSTDPLITLSVSKKQWNDEDFRVFSYELDDKIKLIEPVIPFKWQ